MVLVITILLSLHESLVFKRSFRFKISSFFIICLTEYTSVELHASGYKSIPAHHIQTDITRCEWPQETVCNNKVSFLVAKEDLFQQNKDNDYRYNHNRSRDHSEQQMS